ncbi:uncharacterized protein DS421_9g258100 [Arachis hypogaea]|nr:uncharacterized protein DS421_9g258100 [Arachis hypogaea]
MAAPINLSLLSLHHHPLSLSSLPPLLPPPVLYPLPLPPPPHHSQRARTSVASHAQRSTWIWGSRTSTTSQASTTATSAVLSIEVHSGEPLPPLQPPPPPLLHSSCSEVRFNTLDMSIGRAAADQAACRGQGGGGFLPVPLRLLDPLPLF